MATKANLLVVDDELIVRDSLDKWFREEGYDVTVAESAHDALAKMAARRFDLASDNPYSITLACGPNGRVCGLQH